MKAVGGDHQRQYWGVLSGGGVSNDGTLNITNTIISGSSPHGGDCVIDIFANGTINTNDKSLIQDGGFNCGTPAVTGDLSSDR